MNKKLFEWWLGRPKPVRYAVALFFLGASTVLYLLGRVWFWGSAFGGGCWSSTCSTTTIRYSAPTRSFTLNLMPNAPALNQIIVG
jgi:hypothetical protein